LNAGWRTVWQMSRSEVVTGAADRFRHVDASGSARHAEEPASRHSLRQLNLREQLAKRLERSGKKGPEPEDIQEKLRTKLKINLKRRLQIREVRDWQAHMSKEDLFRVESSARNVEHS